ncbi:hypothetical protein SASPL_105155 [Salvia splendens]|uniref:RNase H type-1 domain-containing protein n=1 Tax=Salvia splendens TaxID=180675 RepID=A0A8X9AAG9_SALSN|nr:hypothetical protein SASPL_105155 [Salvia splendens]
MQPRGEITSFESKRFLEGRTWNENLVQSLLVPLEVPSEVAADIVKTPFDSGAKDTLRWKPSPHGNFTTGSAWELCRDRDPPTTQIVFNPAKQHLQHLITSGKLRKEHWTGCEIGEGLDTSVWKEKPRKQVKLIRCIPPDTGWIKLNIEGSWCSTGAGAGGILRDDTDSLIWGFRAKIIASSRRDAILQAVCLGRRAAHSCHCLEAEWPEYSSPVPASVQYQKLTDFGRT